MNIARFEPWSVVDLLHRDLDRLTRRRDNAEDSNTLANWTPAVDIIERKDRFVLRADVPGVEAQDIDVSMDAGVLSVSGVRHAESASDEDGITRFERSTGSFLRRFTLPDSADAEGITASNKNGILEVSIPKKPEVQARRITVEAA